MTQLFKMSNMMKVWLQVGAKLHPIHSLTNSDIELALSRAQLGDGRTKQGGQLACYTLAIMLAITIVIAVVFILSNIVSNMYSSY